MDGRKIKVKQPLQSQRTIIKKFFYVHFNGQGAMTKLASYMSKKLKKNIPIQAVTNAFAGKQPSLMNEIEKMYVTLDNIIEGN